jgi:hypothetical protein
MTDDYPYASPPGARTWQADWPPAYVPATHPAIALPLALIVAGVMLVLSGGNALMVPAIESIQGPGPGVLVGLSFVMAMAGSIGAQAALVTILVVFGTGALWQRLLWHWGLAFLGVSSWCLGFVMTQLSAIDWQDFYTAMLALPLVALASQALPWVLRTYGRWRIEMLPASTVAATSETPFLTSHERRVTIRDFLVGTVLVGVPLAAARLGKPDGVSDAEYWMILLSICGASAAVVVIGGLPTVYFVLGLRDWRAGLAGSLAVAAAVATMFAVVLIYLPGGGPTGIERIAMAIALVGGFAGPLAGTLLLARMYGYRLVRI